MIDPNPNYAVTSRLQIEAAGLPATLTSSRPPALSAAPDVTGLAMAFRRCWKLAIVAGIILAALVGASAWFIVPKSKYTARATLHVSSNPKYIIFDPKERLTDYRTYQRTQVALAKSHYVLADALKGHEVESLPTVREHVDPCDWLSQHISIDFPDASEVLEISLSGDRPDDLAKLVNATVDSYMLRVVEEEEKERHARLGKLKSLWNRYQLSLQSKREQFRKLTDSIGANDQRTLSVTHQAKIQHRDLAESELMRMKFELRKAESELAVVEARVEDTIAQESSQEAIDEKLESHPHILELHRQYRKLQDRYNQVTRVASRKDDLSVVAVRKQMEAVRSDLGTTRAKLRPVIAGQVHSQVAQDDREALAKLRGRVGSTRMYMEAISKDIERVQEESKVINRSSIDLTQQQDEILIVSETARKIGAEVEAMEVELGAPPRIRVVDRATIPTIKDKFRKVKASGAAATGALMLVIVGFSVREFRARRINTIDEVAQGLGLRIVGSLPPLSVRSRGSNELLRQSLLLESIAATRTMLLHASRTGGIRMVMITSAMKGEGKTTLSYHLANSLARIGRRTLLIDGDIRSPRVDQLFGIPLNPGLCEVLRGEATASDAIWTPREGGPDVLPAGKGDPRAIRALAQDVIRNLFQDLKAQYDFIIIDSSPVLAVADPLLIAQVVDAVLYSVLRDVSRVPMVYAAYERLTALGIQTLGAVVSGVTGETQCTAYPYGSEETTDRTGVALAHCEDRSRQPGPLPIGRE
ncbi:polysaccharide biosynthesis tyrosine autokinase [Singulisphaera sp. PoT]|uniref:polysaccharide biosynthesis tyrosine autokinase n=1 Tax=Singulisphaera sp. PoT TaxID=3411797 RepID=UPI003BF4A115